MYDNAGQQYLSVCQGSGAGWPRVCAGVPHGLELGFGCQVIHILLMLSDSSPCAFIPGPSSPLSCHGKYVVSILCFH